MNCIVDLFRRLNSLPTTALDLSRDCAASLTKYRVAKENTDDITTNRGIRAHAMRVALTSGLPRRQVAADFGIGFSTMSRWNQQDRRNPEKPAAQSDLEREVTELRKENRMLRDERDVLKKTVPGGSPLVRGINSLCYTKYEGQLPMAYWSARPLKKRRTWAVAHLRVVTPLR